MHNGKIHIDQALTPSHLFTTMKTTGIVICGLTLLTESLVFQISLAVICPSNRFQTNFTIKKSEILSEDLRHQSAVQTKKVEIIKPFPRNCVLADLMITKKFSISAILAKDIKVAFKFYTPVECFFKCEP